MSLKDLPITIQYKIYLEIKQLRKLNKLNQESRMVQKIF